MTLASVFILVVICLLNQDTWFKSDLVVVVHTENTVCSDPESVIKSPRVTSASSLCSWCLSRSLCQCMCVRVFVWERESQRREERERVRLCLWDRGNLLRRLNWGGWSKTEKKRGTTAVRLHNEQHHWYPHLTLNTVPVLSNTAIYWLLLVLFLESWEKKNTAVLQHCQPFEPVPNIGLWSRSIKNIYWK